MSDIIEISGRKIGPGYEPLIVAEISGNHNQSLKKALEIAQNTNSKHHELINDLTSTIKSRIS